MIFGGPWVLSGFSGVISRCQRHSEAFRWHSEGIGGLTEDFSGPNKFTRFSGAGRWREERAAAPSRATAAPRTAASGCTERCEAIEARGAGVREGDEGGGG